MAESVRARVLLILIFCSITVCVITVYLTPFSGYEVDFHDHLSALSIAGLVTALISFHTLMYHHYSRKFSCGWIQSLFSIIAGILLTTTAVHLPRIVGYTFTHRDPATHFQTISVVLTHGRLPEEGNMIYPLMYPHIGSFSLLTGLSPQLSYSLSGVSYYLCIVAGAALLIRYFTTRNTEIVLGMWAAFSIIPFSWFPRTRLVGYLIGLFWIAAVLRTDQNIRWRLLAAGLTPVLVLAHIFVAIVSTIYIGLSALFIVRLQRRYFTLFLSLSTIGLTIGLWMTVRGLWSRAVLPIFTSRGGASLALGSVLNLGSYFGYSLFEFTNLAFLRLGSLIIASLVAGAYFLSRAIDRVLGSAHGRIEWDYFSGAIPVIGLVGTLQFVTGAINVTGLRIFNIIRYLTPLYLVYLLRRHKNTVSIIISLILLLSLLNGIVIYPNDLTKTPSGMITASDEDGVSWFIEYKSKDIVQHTLIISIDRRYGYLLPADTQEYRQGEFRKQRLPEDADYRNDTITSILNGKSYIVINSRDRQTYLNTYKGWRYGSPVFKRIQTGRKSNQIYSNGNLNVYLAS